MAAEPLAEVETDATSHGALGWGIDQADQLGRLVVVLRRRCRRCGRGGCG